MDIKKILVTGSSGTIGTRLCEKLLEKGYQVVGADWKPNKWSARVQDITLDIDLRDKFKVIDKLPKDIDLVIHLAANARVFNLVVDPDLARDNFLTLFNMLEYARINRIPRFIFSSSREVYGNSDKQTYFEDEADVKNCESPYSASKISGEALVRSYQKCYNIDFVIFRFSNVYGMYDDSDRVVPLFIKLCRQGKDLIVFGKDKSLDFTYIDDTISGVISSIERFESVRNNVYNLAFGESTSISELARMIKELTGSRVSININDNRTGEVVKYTASISKAKEKLGYNPKTDIKEGLKKSVEWCNKYKN